MDSVMAVRHPNSLAAPEEEEPGPSASQRDDVNDVERTCSGHAGQHGNMHVGAVNLQLGKNRGLDRAIETSGDIGDNAEIKMLKRQLWLAERQPEQ